VLDTAVINAPLFLTTVSLLGVYVVKLSLGETIVEDALKLLGVRIWKVELNIKLSGLLLALAVGARSSILAGLLSV